MDMFFLLDASGSMKQTKNDMIETIENLAVKLGDLTTDR